MNETGIWTGILNNKIGTFKFINVELIEDSLVTKQITKRRTRLTKSATYLSGLASRENIIIKENSYLNQLQILKNTPIIDLFNKNNLKVNFLNS
jgi:hypothetical protein